MTVTLLVVAGLVAVVDWCAVQWRLFRVEYAAKPLTLVVLIAAAASAELPHTKGWIIAALVLGLAGDIALMRSSDAPGPPDPPFLLGLGSFLLGHICYLVAFIRFGLHGLQLIAGLLIVLGIAALTLPRVLGGARTSGGVPLAAVVGGYATLLAAMAVLGVGTAAVATAIGGVLFLVSDSLIAQQRFVRPVANGPLLVIVTYHLAQGLILIGLVHSF